MDPPPGRLSALRPRARAGTSLGDDEGENQPLLGCKLVPAPVLAKCRRRLRAELSLDRADVVLLLCYIITGLLDSASIQVWGAFVSMQTGNTVYVGLGLASLAWPPPNSRLFRSGLSLLSFCLGSFLFARFHRFYSPRRRWVLCLSFAIQAILTATAAIIVTTTRLPSDPDSLHWAVLLPLALVAFSSCGQAVASRALKYNALTSVVLTSIYCDLFSDQELFSLHNPDRNRRAAAPLLLLAGAVAGGLFSHSYIGISGPLWTAAAMKLVICFAWFFWPAEKEEEEEEEEEEDAV